MRGSPPGSGSVEVPRSPERSEPLRIWVDLANSPHPVLFEPIVAALEGLGHEVVISVRDHAQTLALAEQRWPRIHVIGERSPAGVAGKIGSIGRRARDLFRFARRQELDVAASHNSYAQTVAARALRIPCLTAMDYEHQPASHVAFRCADRVLVPEDFPRRALRRQGARPHKVWRYRGFKEEVYLHRFAPDPSVLTELGLEEGDPFVVARPSPQGAAYHQFANPLFDKALTRVLLDRTKVVLLPRKAEDAHRYAQTGNPPIVPETPVDTRSLLYYARALLGAGGTMNREAAVLGTPVFGIFVGRLGALDRRLIREGRMNQLTEGFDGYELSQLAASGDQPAPATVSSHVLDRFVEAIVTPGT